MKKKTKQPLALGIHWAHDASVALCSPEGIICAIQEERLTRIKHYYGFPCQALEKVLAYSGYSVNDISILAFSSQSGFYSGHLNDYSVDANGYRRKIKKGSSITIFNKWIEKILLKDLNWQQWKIKRNNQKILSTIKNKRNEFIDRHYLTKEKYLTDLGLMDERIVHYYVSHHRAHASSAFRLSAQKDSCVMTVDGKGNDLSATISKGYPDGRIKLLRSTKACHSIGAFYQAATEALGFIPVEGEYKTMGLAAFGKNMNSENHLKRIIRVKDGSFRSQINWKYRSYNEFNPLNKVNNPLSSVCQSDDYKKKLESMSREQFAFFIQQHLEENMLEFTNEAMKITRCKNITAAGGVMLNVKANALIRDQLHPSSFFVFPDASDSGLAAGAALEALYQEGYMKKQLQFTNPFLGDSYNEEKIQKTLQIYKIKYGLKVKKCNLPSVAEEITKGKVIGTFQERMEIGPRALGNRSVLADPRKASIKDKINLILKGRDWFVPFAPAVLKEDAHLYWKGSTDYPYMTFTVTASNYARKHVPAVVHVDGTMRPEVVLKEFNPWFYKLLCEFKKLSGIGVLLNTSFNRHGLPIVGSPQDAIEHLLNGWIDGLFIGNLYIEKDK